VGQKKYNDAIDLMQSGISELLKHEQINSATELANLLFDGFRSASAPVNQENLDIIKNLASLYPHHKDNRAKVSFMKSALKWVIDQKNKDAEQQLLNTFGKLLLNGKDYGRSYQYLIKTENIDDLVMLLVEWTQQSLPTERDLFVTRAVLNLASQGKVKNADDVLHKFLEHYYPLQTPLINFLRLLLLTLQKKSESFQQFDLLRTKYKRSLSRDPEFVVLIDTIAQKFYKIPPPNTGGIGNLLQNLVRGMMTENP